MAHWFIFVFLSIAVAGAQPQKRSKSKVLLHEPIPKPERFLEATQERPALLIEPHESSESSAAVDGGETVPEDEGLAIWRTIRVVGNIDCHAAQEFALGIAVQCRKILTTGMEIHGNSFPATSSLIS